MRPIAARPPRAAAWILLGYAAWIALLWWSRVTVVSPAGKAWDLRVRQVWRLPGEAIHSRAPWAEPIYVAALVCLVLATPFVAWTLARVREATDPDSLLPGTSDVVPVDDTSIGLSGRSWCAAVLPVCLMALLVMVPRPVSSLVETDAGRVRIANGFATGAHPLAVSEADSLRRHLASGETLAWVARHQGGYPAESGSPGLAWTDVIVSVLTFGWLPLAYAHTLVAIAVFFLPLVAFVLLSRGDEWPAAVAAAAAILHIVLPGTPFSGGYRTIVELGRVDDAGAAAFALLFLFFVTRGRTVSAAACAAAAIWWSPETAAFTLAVALAGAAIASAVERRGLSTPFWQPIGWLIVSIVLLTAPVWVSFVQSVGLYAPPRRAYAHAGEYLYASMAAVTPPVFVFVLLGGAAVMHRRRGYGVGVAIAGVLVAVIAMLDASGAQLPCADAGRLMPFQRLLSVYLAGVGLHALVRHVTQAAGFASARCSDLVALGALAALAFVFIGPLPMDEGKAKGLFEPTTVTDMHVADLAAAARAAQAIAGERTAILVVGPVDPGSTDLSLWAPVLADGLFFYKDPVRHWRRAAPDSFERVWDPRAQAPMPRLLSSASLATNGIGAVVVSSDARALARDASATLTAVRTGSDYDTYAVVSPTSVIGWAGTLTRIEVTDHRMLASGTTTGGAVDVRRNWHPRWRALVNGRNVPVHETERGFMRVAVAPGPLDLRMEYDRGWLARLAPVASAGGLLLLALRRKRSV